MLLLTFPERVIKIYGRKEGNVLFNDTLNTFYLKFMDSLKNRDDLT